MYRFFFSDVLCHLRSLKLQRTNIAVYYRSYSLSSEFGKTQHTYPVALWSVSSVIIKHPGPEEDLRWCHQGNDCFTGVVWKACCLTVWGGVRAMGKWSREYPTLLEPQPCLERTLCVFPDWHSLWRGHNNMTREGRGSGLFVWHPPLYSPRLWHCMNLLNFSLRGFSP